MNRHEFMEPKPEPEEIPLKESAEVAKNYSKEVDKTNDDYAAQEMAIEDINMAVDPMPYGVIRNPMLLFNPGPPTVQLPDNIQDVILVWQGRNYHITSVSQRRDGTQIRELGNINGLIQNFAPTRSHLTIEASE